MEIVSTELLVYLVISLPIIAFLYSSVGHGGASGYLALMALLNFSPLVMKPTALLLNIFVSIVSFYFYFKEGYFNKRLFWSVAISSIPMSFIGGTIEIEAGIYKKILGVFLIIAIARIVIPIKKESPQIRDINLIQTIFIGAIIGFFSGLIGIGGGIILTPIILLLGWGNMKEAAGVSALFIFVNSIAGIIGQFSIGVEFGEETILMVFLAFFGGLIGAFFGSKHLENSTLKTILAVVLAIACLKLFFAN